MNVQKFEQICRESRMVPLEKQVTKNGAVLLAERKVRVPEHQWETLWAIERDNLDIAGIVKSPVYRKDGDSARPTTQPERVNAAMDAAKQFISDSMTVGRYA